jgi:hypothetical protein
MLSWNIILFDISENKLQLKSNAEILNYLEKTPNKQSDIKMFLDNKTMHKLIATRQI